MCILSRGKRKSRFIALDFLFVHNFSCIHFKKSYIELVMSDLVILRNQKKKLQNVERLGVKFVPLLFIHL